MEKEDLALSIYSYMTTIHGNTRDFEEEVCNDLAEMILEEYLKPLIRNNIDTLILGCTHYGILERKIRKIIGSDVHIISEAKVVPHKLEEYLQRHTEIENRIGRGGLERIYTTDLTEGFKTRGSIFLGKHINVQKITLT